MLICTVFVCSLLPLTYSQMGESGTEGSSTAVITEKTAPKPDGLWYTASRLGAVTSSGKVKPLFRCLNPEHASEHRNSTSLKKCEDVIAVLQAQKWLAAQQKQGGRWMCETWQGGHEIYDVGVTALALLALQSYGNTLTYGDYQSNIQRGVDFLTTIQNKNGGFGRETGQANPFNQALATMALCEAYAYGEQPLKLVEPIQRALSYIHNSRNPYSGWRYASVPNGNSDSVVTAWMCLALMAAKGAGFSIDEIALKHADDWFRTMTGETGRVGYALGSGGGPGSLAFRYAKPFDNSKISRSISDSITAGALAVRLLQATPTDPSGQLQWKLASFYEDLQRQLAMLRKNVPKVGQVGDYHYWFWASLATHQYGDEAWSTWRSALHQVLRAKQETAGVDESERELTGSWAPDTVWAAWGGRIYTTAMATLILTTEMRYRPALERAKLADAQ